MNHKIWYDDKNGILREKVSGEFSAAEVDEFFKPIRDLLEGKPNRFALLDLSDATNLDPAAESRLTEEVASIGYQRLAVLTPAITPAAKAISKVLLSVNGLGGACNFFTTEAEALAWLKG